jgi:hypothetical protein
MFFSVRSHIWWPVEVLNAGAESFFDSGVVKGHFQRSGNLPKSIGAYLPFNYCEGNYPLSVFGNVFGKGATAYISKFNLVWEF